MLERFKSEKSLCEEILYLFERKKQLGSDIKGMRKTTELQLKAARALSRKASSTDESMIKDILHAESNDKEMEIIGAFNKLNKSQMAVLVDSLKQEYTVLERIGQDLIALYTQQLASKEPLWPDSQVGAQALSREAEIIRRLADLVSRESDLQKRVKGNIEMAGHLEHSEVFRNFVKGVSKVIILAKFNLTISGQENIPDAGPVIITPRHFHGDFDPALFNTIVKRNAFFLGAMDWMKDGAEITINKIVFKKDGVVPINRPDSIFEKPDHYLLSAYKSIVRLLMLNQAVIIFPEGYGKIDAHYTKQSADGQFLKMKLGVFHFVDYVQKKTGRQVPIIPVGTDYANLENFRMNVVVNVGKPIYLPIQKGIMDYEQYRRQLEYEIKRLSLQGARIDNTEKELIAKAA